MKYRALLHCSLCSFVPLLFGCDQKVGIEETTSDPPEASLSGSPEVAIQSILYAMGNQQGSMLWAAMPKSYQNDVNEMVHLAGNQVDAEIYDKAFSTIRRLVTIADQQKAFILNTAVMGEPMPADEKVKIEAAWPSLVSLISTITKSPISSAQGLQSFDGQTFFSETVSTLLGDIEAIAALNPEELEISLRDLTETKVALVEKTDSTARLQINFPGGESEEESFAKVDNRWVPQQLSLDWADSVARSRAQLEAIDRDAMAEQKPQLMNIFVMIDAVLSQLEAAETQAQFDQAVKGAMMPLMGIMMMGQSGSAAPEIPAEAAMPPAPVSEE